MNLINDKDYKIYHAYYSTITISYERYLNGINGRCIGGVISDCDGRGTLGRKLHF